MLRARLMEPSSSLPSPLDFRGEGAVRGKESGPLCDCFLTWAPEDAPGPLGAFAAVGVPQAVAATEAGPAPLALSRVLFRGVGF